MWAPGKAGPCPKPSEAPAKFKREEAMNAQAELIAKKKAEIEAKMAGKSGHGHSKALSSEARKPISMSVSKRWGLKGKKPLQSGTVTTTAESFAQRPSSWEKLTLPRPTGNVSSSAGEYKGSHTQADTSDRGGHFVTMSRQYTVGVAPPPPQELQPPALMQQPPHPQPHPVHGPSLLGPPPQDAAFGGQGPQVLQAPPPPGVMEQTPMPAPIGPPPPQVVIASQPTPPMMSQPPPIVAGPPLPSIPGVAQPQTLVQTSPVGLGPQLVLGQPQMINPPPTSTVVVSQPLPPSQPLQAATIVQGPPPHPGMVQAIQGPVISQSPGLGSQLPEMNLPPPVPPPAILSQTQAPVLVPSAEPQYQQQQHVFERHDQPPPQHQPAAPSFYPGLAQPPTTVSTPDRSQATPPAYLNHPPPPATSSVSFDASKPPPSMATSTAPMATFNPAAPPPAVMPPAAMPPAAVPGPNISAAAAGFAAFPPPHTSSMAPATQPLLPAPTMTTMSHPPPVFPATASQPPHPGMFEPARCSLLSPDGVPSVPGPFKKRASQPPHPGMAGPPPQLGQHRPLNSLPSPAQSSPAGWGWQDKPNDSGPAGGPLSGPPPSHPVPPPGMMRPGGLPPPPQLMMQPDQMGNPLGPEYCRQDAREQQQFGMPRQEDARDTDFRKYRRGGMEPDNRQRAAADDYRRRGQRSWSGRDDDHQRDDDRRRRRDRSRDDSDSDDSDGGRHRKERRHRDRSRERGRRRSGDRRSSGRSRLSYGDGDEQRDEQRRYSHENDQMSPRDIDLRRAARRDGESYSPTRPTRNTEASDDSGLPCVVEELAHMVAVSGEDLEDIARERNKTTPELVFLNDKSCTLYKMYRSRVSDLKRSMSEPSQEKLKAEERKEGRERKRKSRWGDEAPAQALPPPGIMTVGPPGGMVAPPVGPPGVLAPPVGPPGVVAPPFLCAPGVAAPTALGMPAHFVAEGGGDKLGIGDAIARAKEIASVVKPDTKLADIQRSNPELVAYATRVFGTTNLSEQQWKQCEDQLKMSVVYGQLAAKQAASNIMAAAGKNKFEYDSDEDVKDGTWEHRLRKNEMEKTAYKAQELTEAAEGKHHIGDFLPPEELNKFMNKYKAMRTGSAWDNSEYQDNKLTSDNVGFKMLQKMGWSEGAGLGTSGQGITAPVNKAEVGAERIGLGVEKPGDLQSEDDEFDAYRKRMMLAYRFRPNPLNNPRRAYY